MIAAVVAASLLGATGHQVVVEVHVGQGLPGFQVVGLPDESCREARDRVRAAVLSSGLPWPATKRITVNLAPSGVRKTGSGLDLAIAIAVLVADDAIDAEAVRDLAFIGELGLDGSVRSVAGVTPMVVAVCSPEADPGAERGVVVAPASHHEAAAVAQDRVRVVSHLAELVAALRGDAPWPDIDIPPIVDDTEPPPDLADVRGQLEARAGIEIAAAGGHHLLLVGPPGSGKTMIARRLVGLLPPLDPATSLEVTMVHSAAGVRLPAGGVIRQPVLRAPHHSSSMVSLIGGGSSTLRPGEISLAHGGALFLDELGEFPPAVLDALRQPLEEGVVRVARAHLHVIMPARFLLVAATNPCPCGGGPPGACECDAGAVAKYAKRLSGPLLDRFDLRVAVQRTGVDDLLSARAGEPSSVVRARVLRARDVAMSRRGMLNAALPPGRIDELAPLTAEAYASLRTEVDRGRLSGRGYHRIRRVARTIADLEPEPTELVEDRHVALALRLRVTVGQAARRAVA